MPRKVRDSFPNPFRAAAELAPPHLPGGGEEQYKSGVLLDRRPVADVE